ncbi:MAG: ATP-dependent helicase HrpB [Proteobacteria bacterium]|nr:ATP-dependent helicase HrpB [Pseudomonadota bacterium]
MPLQPLPIDEVLPELVDALGSAGSAVVVAPPGSGKTTRVPPAILDSGLVGDGRVLVLQPRRVAARLAAARIADERGVRLGDEVGYRTRFDRRTGKRTRLEVLTVGLLVRWIQGDPFLDGVGCVVLDEFHERSLDLDLALALLREVQRDAREDLRILVMSATMDPEPVVAFLGGPDACPVIEAGGRPFPVTIEHDKRPSQLRTHERVAAAVRRALAATDHGHVLAFLPGVGEIDRTGGALRSGDRALPASIPVLPLHGRLAPKDQDAALAPFAGRKVVLATNLAETSVTLVGVTAVVDSGLARVPRFDSGAGVTRLETKRISLASADQRAGRAGRTEAGLCLRLWTPTEHAGLARVEQPEVRRCDLAPASLELKAWGAEPEGFGWYEAPPPGSLARASQLLHELGAFEDGSITPLGRQLAELPVHPRLGSVVLAGRAAGILENAAAAAALVDSPDPLRGAPADDDDDDLARRLDAIDRFAHTGRPPPGTDRRALAEILRIRDQLIRIATAATGSDPAQCTSLRSTELGSDPAQSSAAPLVPVLLAGFPDRVARRRDGAVDRYVLSSGSGAVLDRRSAARGSELLLALGLDAGARAQRAEHRIRLAVPLTREQLPTVEADELTFDTAKAAVVHRHVVRFGRLVLEESPASGAADPWEQARILAAAAAADLDRALAPSPEVLQLLGRLRLLRTHCPELGLPDLSDLSPLLEQLCHGRRTFAQLRKADLKSALMARLDGRQRQALKAEAPERMRVPSGSTVRLRYDPDGQRHPVLAARIQQLFGWQDTPRIARGRAALTLELLAPNQRPQQTTTDLAGFWAGTYADVRKDLRGRYPKHSWPEDPANAEPEDRPRRKRR